MDASPKPTPSTPSNDSASAPVADVAVQQTAAAPCPSASRREAFLARHPWIAPVAPFVVFMLVGSLEPSAASDASSHALAIPYSYYPVVYALRIALTLATILFVLPGYRKYRFRLSFWSLAVGIVGIAAWVGICSLRIESDYLSKFGLKWLVGLGARSGYNPFESLREEDIRWAWIFFGTRLFGLALVVPVIEEFFLRAFLVPLVVRNDWSTVGVGELNRTAIVAVVAYAVATHPAELVAAVVWFSMVTWLSFKTKNIWDCVAAHAVTNLLLGLYVYVSGAWHLL
jgi:CAAX prenyl protease-like protein